MARLSSLGLYAPLAARRLWLRVTIVFVFLWSFVSASAASETGQSEPGSASEAGQSEPSSGVGTTPAAKPEKSAADDPRITNMPRGGLFSQWNTTDKRWFVSARADVGFLFIRPRVSFGYGIPHQAWTGLDIVPILSSTQGGGYVGLRYRHPRIEVRSGVLYSAAFYRGYLPAGQHFDGRDLELQASPQATFWANDSEFTLSFPLLSGFVQSETQTLFVVGVPDDHYVFAETIGAIVAPPWAVREQIRYTFPIKAVPGLFLGPAVEGVFIPAREHAYYIRAGGSLRFRLYQDLQIRTDILPTVYGPDTLGREGSGWLTINARFFWASN